MKRAVLLALLCLAGCQTTGQTSATVARSEAELVFRPVEPAKARVILPGVDPASITGREAARDPQRYAERIYIAGGLSNGGVRVLFEELSGGRFQTQTMKDLLVSRNNMTMQAFGFGVSRDLIVELPYRDTAIQMFSARRIPYNTGEVCFIAEGAFASDSGSQSTARNNRHIQVVGCRPGTEPNIGYAYIDRIVRDLQIRN